MLEKLRLFLVVLEEGSLRRAADRLRISQSAISLHFSPERSERRNGSHR